MAASGGTWVKDGSGKIVGFKTKSGVTKLKKHKATEPGANAGGSGGPSASTGGTGGGSGASTPGTTSGSSSVALKDTHPMLGGVNAGDTLVGNAGTKVKIKGYDGDKVITEGVNGDKEMSVKTIQTMLGSGKFKVESGEDSSLPLQSDGQMLKKTNGTAATKTSDGKYHLFVDGTHVSTHDTQTEVAKAQATEILKKFKAAGGDAIHNKPAAPAKPANVTEIPASQTSNPHLKGKTRPVSIDNDKVLPATKEETMSAHKAAIATFSSAALNPGIPMDKVKATTQGDLMVYKGSSGYVVANQSGHQLVTGVKSKQDALNMMSQANKSDINWNKASETGSPDHMKAYTLSSSLYDQNTQLNKAAKAATKAKQAQSKSDAIAAAASPADTGKPGLQNGSLNKLKPGDTMYNTDGNEAGDLLSHKENVAVIKKPNGGYSIFDAQGKHVSDEPSMGKALAKQEEVVAAHLASQPKGGPAHPDFPDLKVGDKLINSDGDVITLSPTKGKYVSGVDQNGNKYDYSPSTLKILMDEGDLKPMNSTSTPSAATSSSSSASSHPDFAKAGVKVGDYLEAEDTGPMQVVGHDGKYLLIKDSEGNINKLTGAEVKEGKDDGYYTHTKEEDIAGSASPHPANAGPATIPPSTGPYTLQGDEKFTKGLGDHAVVWDGKNPAKVVNTKTGEVVSTGLTSPSASNSALTKAHSDAILKDPNIAKNFDVNVLPGGTVQLNAKAQHHASPPWKDTTPDKDIGAEGSISKKDPYSIIPKLKQDYADVISHPDSVKGRSGVKSYQGNGYQAINSTLYTAKGSSTKGMPKHNTIQAIDKAMNVSRVKEPLTVVRAQGKDHPIYQQMGAINVGDEFTSHGYDSTSTNPNHSWGGNAVRIVYRVPAGTRGIFMNAYDDSLYPNEHELLLARGTRSKVVGKTVTSDGKITVTVEIVGQENLETYGGGS